MALSPLAISLLQRSYHSSSIHIVRRTRPGLARSDRRVAKSGFRFEQAG
jgi:hypothetical protein